MDNVQLFFSSDAATDIRIVGKLTTDFQTPRFRFHGIIDVCTTYKKSSWNIVFSLKKAIGELKFCIFAKF